AKRAAMASTTTSISSLTKAASRRPTKEAEGSTSSRAEGAVDDVFGSRREGQLQRRRVGLWAHLPPGLASDVDELVIVVLGRKGVELELKEHQAGDIF